MAQNGAAKSNPFGNYSFMEAQGTKTTKTEPTTPMAMKESPFGNYSFREAQQSRNAAEPSSPISSRSNNFRTDDTAPVQNTSSIHSFMAAKPEKPIAFEGYSFSEAQGDSPSIG
ncbi:hypothetical protein DL89DRAFT_92642 [Linderina pennispora]|uniref:Uncharacterized protein n=1 Tax=Linderina pennispora TaxID=61395 RepID=A0A1Y1VYC7_9FUNG|nr:uncharacterized protein DL89DRAFT_92642 [Linderina pennispora]ORX65824.1 hypothetical protein DL89DRAFT_92642 [Linderina pennispora]